MRFLTLLYTLLIRFGIVLAPIVLLLIRLAWGWELFESGHGHLTNLDETIKNFTGWGISHPRFNAYVSGYTGNDRRHILSCSDSLLVWFRSHFLSTSAWRISPPVT